MTEGKKRRGFAAMDPELHRELARRGGRAIPAEKRSFSRDRDLAKEAGRKGGVASHKPEPLPPEETNTP